MRAFGADDGKPNRTPPAWMKPLAPPVPSPVLSAGHISRTLLGHSCQAPTYRRQTRRARSPGSISVLLGELAGSTARAPEGEEGRSVPQRLDSRFAGGDFRGSSEYEIDWV